MIPSCQALSKTFYISKKAPLTSAAGFSSKAVWISWIIDNNWAIQGSPGKKNRLGRCEKSVTLKISEKGTIYSSFKYFPKNRK